MTRPVASPSTLEGMVRAIPVAFAALALLAGCAPATPELTTPMPDPGGAPPSSAPAPTAAPSTAAPTPEPETDQGTLNQRLRDAAWKGDVDAASELLAKGADVNAKDHSIQSAYLIAASEGHLPFVKLALENGASVSDTDSWGSNALTRASERGHAAIAGVLIQADIERNQENKIGYLPIHEAIWLGQGDEGAVDTVRVLVAGGADVERESAAERLTPLQMAQDRGFDEITATLEAALSPDEVKDPGVELLLSAAIGDADQVARMLRLGGDIESKDSQERTALLLATTSDQVDAAKLLVNLGAEVDVKDAAEESPWLLAAGEGDVDMGKALQQADPDMEITNADGSTALIVAAAAGHEEYVKYLLTLPNAGVNAVNTLGYTALIEAVRLGEDTSGTQAIVTALLAAGANPELTDANGMTAADHIEERELTQVKLDAVGK